MGKASNFVSFQFLFLALFVFNAVGAVFQPPQTNRLKVNINTNWKFNLGDVTGAQAATFSDAAWSTVHLPHNFQTLPDNRRRLLSGHRMVSQACYF